MATDPSWRSCAQPFSSCAPTPCRRSAPRPSAWRAFPDPPAFCLGLEKACVVTLCPTALTYRGPAALSSMHWNHRRAKIACPCECPRPTHRSRLRRPHCRFEETTRGKIPAITHLSTMRAARKGTRSALGSATPITTRRKQPSSFPHSTASSSFNRSSPWINIHVYATLYCETCFQQHPLASNWGWSRMLPPPRSRTPQRSARGPRTDQALPQPSQQLLLIR